MAPTGRIVSNEPPPSLETLSERLRHEVVVRSVGITILAFLAVVYTLYFGRAFFVPVVFAILLNFLFSPIIRAARRIGIPPAASAALVVLTLVGVIGGGGYELAAPARDWLSAAPVALNKASVKIRTLLKPMDQVTKAAEQVERVTSGGNGPPTPQVVLEGPSMRSRFFGTTQSIVGALLGVLVLLFFLLAAGDLFLQKLIKVLPQLPDKITAVEIARATEASISIYLMTSALLNLIEGSLVAIALYCLGMPNAILWGVVVVILEFIPYVGAATIVAILSLAALTVFNSVSHALLIPGTFVLINLFQGNVVSPIVLGHRLALNPVAMFIGLAFWWELWGIQGAFLAIPLLSTLKIFCDHIEMLAPIGEFLGQRDEEERRSTVRVDSAA